MPGTDWSAAAAKATALRTETLHRASQPDRVEHGRGREVPIGQLPDETGLHHVDQRGMHAPIRGLGVDEIALLQREPPEVVARHGTRFVELADEEVGQSLLRLTLRLRRLHVLMRGLGLKLSLKRGLRLRLKLRLRLR